MKVGLALGSGGVRGFAHLGVIEVLEREGIPIDLIVGSSAGAAIGAMYAFRPKLQPNLTHVRQYLHSELYGTTRLHYLQQNEETRRNFYEKMKIRFTQGAVVAATLTRTSLFSFDELRKNVEFLVPPVNIEESLIPFAAVTFDMVTGEELLIDEGSLIDAIMATCAIPGVFPALKRDDQMLMDGGMVNPVPCDHARNLGADLVIGVDLSPRVSSLPQMGNSYDMAMRAADITRQKLKGMLLSEADVVVSPGLSEVFWADFTQFEQCVEAGRQAAEHALPQIRRALQANGGQAGDNVVSMAEAERG